MTRTKNRSHFPEGVEIEVLTKCRRRCALCYALRDDARAKVSGQIAHIDRNSANDAPDNAAYLCLNHHDEYDGARKQSKRFKPDELKYYQALLYEAVPSFGMWPGAPISKERKTTRRGAREGITLEVYDRRILVYRKVADFIRTVAGSADPRIQDILKFANDTDEAIFLYDENIAEYLAGFFRRALRLNAVESMRTRAQGDEYASLVKEEQELLLWFADQPNEARKRFAAFLKLA